MNKKVVVIVIFFLLVLLSRSFCEETLTITTYYPSPYGSYNELTTASNTYLATSGGNVGIGTTGPADNLEVLATEASYTTQLTLTNAQPGGYGSGIDMRGKRSDTSALLSQAKIDTGGEDTWNSNATIDSFLRFWTVQDNALGERVRITSGGNVGIGTTGPSQKLEVAGLSAVSGASGGFLMNPRSGSGAWQWYAQDGKVALYGGAVGSEKVVIDRTGNVGIGTAAPNAPLYILSNNAVNDLHVISTAAGSDTDTYIVLQGVDNDAIIFKDVYGDATARIGMNIGGVVTERDLYITNNLNLGGNDIVLYPTRGNVGIGIGNPGYKLDVAGSAHFTSHSDSSDIRFKKNIKPISDVLDKVKMLHAVSFEWNERYEKMGRATKGRQIGIVAQELEKQFPELVSIWGDGSDYRGVDYGRFTAVLLEAVKEQQKQIDTLKQEITVLKTRLNVK